MTRRLLVTTMVKRKPQRVVQGSGVSGSEIAELRRAGILQAKLPKVDGVVVAYPHRPGDVNARFHTSLIDLLVYDANGGHDTTGKPVGGHGHVTRHGGHMPLSSGANIVTPRNKLVKAFLDDFPSKPEWLWFIDDDMTFEPDTLDRLLASAKWSTADEKAHVEIHGAPSGNRVGDVVRPVMGGLCFALMKGEAQEIVPTLYGFTQAHRMVRYNGFPQDAIVQVVGTGAACLLIHRDVLEAIRSQVWSAEWEEKFRVQSDGVPSGREIGSIVFPPPWPWFAEQITGDQWGDSISEDLTFCLRAAQCGFPVHVNTAIKTGHVKPVVIDEDAYFKGLPPEEAPAPTYVVIPVKGKQHFTDAILKQLVEQGGYDGVFVYDNAAGTDDKYELPLELVDTEEAVSEHRLTGIHLIPAAGKNIYQMWNMGIREALSRSTRCNLAILNNDLELGEDFLKRLADGLRAHPGIAAVSPNYDGRVFSEKVQAVKGIAAGRQDGTGGLAGFAFMVRGEVFQAGCPMFDEAYHLWFGDTVFVDQLDEAGATYGIVRDCTVVHVGGGSNTSGDGKGKRLSDEWTELVKQDEARFVAYRAAKR